VPGLHETAKDSSVHEVIDQPESERYGMQAQARKSALQAWTALEDLWERLIKSDKEMQLKYRARVRGIHYTVMPPECTQEELSLHQRAMALARQSRRNAALKLLHQGMNRFPKNPVFATSAASVYIQLELYDRAQACAKHALELGSNNSVVLQVLGRLCGKVNRPDLARKVFKRSIQVRFLLENMLQKQTIEHMWLPCRETSLSAKADLRLPGVQAQIASKELQKNHQENV
jgi:tetratricopeptide (TPR) repeat protein